MATSSFVQVVSVQYGQYLIVIDGDPFSHGWSQGAGPTGLVDEYSGQISVLTGCENGSVSVRVEVWPSEPQQDLDHWDDVAELHLQTLTGSIHVGGLLEGVPTDAPNLATIGAGVYALRIAVSGRDAVLDHGSERHRIQCWSVTPASPAPALRLLKSTDAVGDAARGEEARPVLRPWEAKGAVAMLRFVALLLAVRTGSLVGAVSGESEFLVESRQLFADATHLQSFIALGGSGIREVGHSAEYDIFHSADWSFTIRLRTFWETASPPLYATWRTQWLKYSIDDSRPKELSPEGALSLRIAQNVEGAALLTIHQTGIPANCTDALTDLWDYWFALYKNHLESGDAVWKPWSWI